MNKARKKVLALVLTLSCATAGLGLFTACNDGGETSEHTHSYTQWAHDNEEHWKVCPDDGAIDESSREDHVFVAGECECGATEAVAPQKYGSASGQVRLHKLGDYVTDYAGVTVDMGNDDVTIEYDETTGKFTIENIVADQQYTLTVSKNGYKPSSVLVQVGENENVTIGGQNGVVLEYDAFQTLMNWDFDAIDFGHANDEDPYLTYNRAGGTFNVLTNESYDSVSATLRINWNNSTNNMRTHGIILVFEDGRHAVVRYHNGDTNGNIQYCNTAWDYVAATSVFGDSANLNQWGENNVHPLTNEERAAITTGDGLDLTVVVGDGQLRTYFAGDWVTTYDLPDDLGKVRVGYFAWDTADKSVFYYGISEEIPSLTAKTDIKVEQPEGIKAAVTADKTEYVMGEQITLTIDIPEGYKLDVITVNGKDMTESVSDDGKLTVTATRNTMAVGVTVVKEEPIALNLTIKGKKLGTTAVLPAETTVTFKGTDYTFTVGENGKVTAPSVVKGKYIVVVDGYLEQEITFNETLTEITLEYDLFENLSTAWGWGDSSDLSKQNEGIITHTTGGTQWVSSNDSYQSVAITATVVAGGQRQGVFIRFAGASFAEDGYMMIQKEWDSHVSWNGEGNIWGFGTNLCTEWTGYVNPLTDDDKAKIAAGEYELTLVRDANKVHVFINGTYYDTKVLNASYADLECYVGIYCTTAKGIIGKERTFRIEDASVYLKDVVITDETAPDANGSLTVTENVRIGDTVSVTFNADSDYIISTLTVDGSEIELSGLQGNTYTFTAKKETYTVAATFEQILHTADVTLSVTGAKYGVSGNSIADGAKVVLKTAFSADVETSVAGGQIVVNDLPYGSYTASVEGYSDVAFTVGESGASVAELAFEYQMFESLVGWDWDNHDFTHVNDENAYITYTKAGGTLNVLTADSYINVSATLLINWNNSTNGQHTQGIILRFADGKHLIVRYHNGDFNGNIQYCNKAWDPYTSENTLFDENANLNQWGENPVHDLTDEERTAITSGGGIELKVEIKDGALVTSFGGEQVATYTLPEGYADQAVQVGYFTWDTPQDAVIYFSVGTAA